MNIASSLVGEIEVVRSGNDSWHLTVETVLPEPGIEEIHLALAAPEPAAPPQLTLKWRTPQLDMRCRWTSMLGIDRSIPADWGPPLKSMLADQLPVMCFVGNHDRNRLTVAVSEAMREVRLKGGVHEETNEIAFELKLFTQPEAPMTNYETILRFDRRDRHFSAAVRAAAAWFEKFPEYRSAMPPAAAFDPIYSSWYSFHQAVFADELEAECLRARAFGLKGIIVDDGWQTEDVQRGYAWCGDWEVAPSRFPDMAAHVARVHAMGLKYVVWYAVPFVGRKSRNYARFEGKYLNGYESLGTGILDPRFPEVREFLISTWENAVRRYDWDGLKLDFIDSFQFPASGDPAEKDNYAGRDMRSLPLAVDKLMTEAMDRLKKLKPEILIEFRQRYIGPAIRKYGNMLRAGDCPGDALSNRVRTVDLRLTSGATAVHSDMLEWNSAETPETAALQLLNVLFAVPQISVKLGEIPETHRNMLKFWLDFAVEHRETLLRGTITPSRPDLAYPEVRAESAAERIIGIYDPARAVTVPGDKTVCLVNATEADSLLLEFDRPVRAIRGWRTTGEPVETVLPRGGAVRVAVPPSGLLKLEF